MDSTFDPLNILLLVVGVVIFIRLRNALGKRTGQERKPFDPFGMPQKRKDASSNDNVLPLPGSETEATNQNHEEEDDPTPIWKGYAKKGSPLANTLQAIREKDHEFHPEPFLQGARIAYETIVTAFAEEDRKTLKGLVTKEVFEGFDNALKERYQAGYTQESSFIGIDKASIIEANLDGKTANMTIKFVSKMISATVAKDGTVVEGDPKKIREVTDIWTFMRNVTSNDPNWHLRMTEAAN